MYKILSIYVALLLGGCLLQTEDLEYEATSIGREAMLHTYTLSTCGGGVYFFGNKGGTNRLGWCCCSPEGEDCDRDGYTSQILDADDQVRLVAPQSTPLRYVDSEDEIDCPDFGISGVHEDWRAELQLVVEGGDLDGPPGNGSEIFNVVLEATGNSSTLRSEDGVDVDITATWSISSGTGYIYGNDRSNTISCTGNCKIYGNDSHDRISCGDGPCWAAGGKGNDYIFCDEDSTPNSTNDCIVYGGEGTDTIYGSLGNCYLFGGDATDVLVSRSYPWLGTYCDCGSGTDYEFDCDVDINCEYHL
jgi:hypothetical protein